MRDETTENLWAKLREAWAEADLAQKRFRTCIWLLREIEWTTRRFADSRLTKDALVELIRQSQFHGPHFDGSHDRPIWDGCEAWADTVEMSALSDLMNRIDKARWDKDDRPPNAELEDAENHLRPWFHDSGGTVSVYEEIVRHPAYTTKTCVVAIVRSKTKIEPIVRADSWPDAIEKAEHWCAKNLYNPLDSRQRKPKPPEFDLDTDAIRIIEPGVLGEDSEPSKES